ncbi:guanine nucleotide binding protein [Reticulomyxa filosa]|uniref:Guanine nucleotide binding protein n=1 Tax=Reticulomyxa filosa TaxID=46433 RepID=X6P2V6_RETFI|nr:guanine nucleotide binding protein [Reticulomyxa filosa]|eukprot:ETO32468.1 guanine nucleotide binding protein [Reticulomyxa filosa]
MLLRNMDALKKLTKDIVEDIHTLWNDKGIQKIFQNRYKFQFPDNAPYFFDQMDDIVPPMLVVNEMKEKKNGYIILFEDKSTSRIVEALKLFNEICNSPWYHFIFKQKIRQIPLICLRDFQKLQEIS